MGISVQNKKLLVDDKVKETNLEAFESIFVYRNNEHAFRFINMKDAAGQVVNVAVASNDRLVDGKFARNALARKIILDEVQNLLKEEFHLKDRYRTDKNTLKLTDTFDKVASQDSRYVPLKTHVEMISSLEGALEDAFGILKSMMDKISEARSFGDGEISELLKAYIHSYVFPLEYELQVKGYLLGSLYSELQSDLHSKKFKLGLFEKKRLKKHVDMMAGLDMKNTPWISILEENLKKPLSRHTDDEKMKSALESHLRTQSKKKAHSIICN